MDHAVFMAFQLGYHGYGVGGSCWHTIMWIAALKQIT